MRNGDTLLQAGVGKAEIISLSGPDSLLKGANNEKLVRHVRTLNPTAKIVSTADLLSDVDDLYAAGADYVTVTRLSDAHELFTVIEAADAGLLEDKRADIDGRLSERRVAPEAEVGEGGGVLTGAAPPAPAERMAFITRHPSGIVCAPIPTEDARRLRLDPMVAHNESSHTTAFTVSIDYKPDGGTGISADERASCCRALANPNAGANDFARPGHVFPLIARDGGVLLRSGHTEAAVDLCKLSGLPPVGVISELMNDDGTVMKGEQVARFATAHKLKHVTIADMIAYR